MKIEGKKAASAVFYGCSSLLIMFSNKIVLSSYEFPSLNFLAVSQFFITTVILWLLNKAGYVQITRMSMNVMRVMTPPAVIFLINVISGLGGTKRLSLPMFTLLRRFSIFMTLLLERLCFGERHATVVNLAVFLMIFGSAVAAVSDLAFELEGYLMIFVSDVFTALNGVVMKKILVNSKINKMGVLYHNSWIGMCVMLSVLALRPQEIEKIQKFPHWKNPAFVFVFFWASCMGSILNYSIFLCTMHNSALTTTVIGCLKNVLSCYGGMIFLDDYVFSLNNFIGLNISILGSLVYSFAEFKEVMKRKAGAGGGGAGGKGGEGGKADTEIGGVSGNRERANSSSNSQLRSMHAANLETAGRQGQLKERGEVRDRVPSASGGLTRNE